MSGYYSVNDSHKLCALWSGWMELASQPLQVGLIDTSDEAAAKARYYKPPKMGCGSATNSFAVCSAVGEVSLLASFP